MIRESLGLRKYCVNSSRKTTVRSHRLSPRRGPKKKASSALAFSLTVDLAIKLATAMQSVGLTARRFAQPVGLSDRQLR